ATASVPARRMSVAAASSCSIVDRPLGRGNAGSLGEPKVHLWTMRDEDGGALAVAFAEPAEEQVHEAQVRRGVHRAEGLVEQEEPQPCVRRAALDAQHLAREDDALPLAFRKGADGPAEQLVGERRAEPATHPVPLAGGARKGTEDLFDRHLLREGASRVL